MRISPQGLLFDLDGVLVDTAKYHYLAWKELANELGIPFTQHDNERLKGVSRTRSLEILLKLGQRTLSQREQEAMCQTKNNLYLNYISELSARDILPYAREFLREAKAQGYQIALGSASKNSRAILQKLEIFSLFDAIIDGTQVTRAKPDPEVFLQGAKALGLSPQSCIVFEDSRAGIQAARRARMKVVGIGTNEQLRQADLLIPGFEGYDVENIVKHLGFCRRTQPCDAYSPAHEPPMPQAQG